MYALHASRSLQRFLVRDEHAPLFTPSLLEVRSQCKPVDQWRECLPEFFWRQRKSAAHALKKTTDRQSLRLRIKVLIPGSFSHPCLQGLDQKRLLPRQIGLQDSGQGRVTPGTEGKFRQHKEEGWFCLHLAGKPLQIRSK